MAAINSWKISLVLARVSAIKMPATQMKSIVKKIDRYFICSIVQQIVPYQQPGNRGMANAGQVRYNMDSIHVRIIGVWRSWLARVVRNDEAGGSSPLTPTSDEI